MRTLKFSGTFNTTFLQRDIVKRYSHNDSVLNNLRTANYLIVGKSHLKKISVQSHLFCISIAPQMASTILSILTDTIQDSPPEYPLFQSSPYRQSCLHGHNNKSSYHNHTSLCIGICHNYVL